ncbi:MAG: DUF3344 domain-containing protein [Phycisphaerae bacterium]
MVRRLGRGLTAVMVLSVAGFVINAAQAGYQPNGYDLALVKAESGLVNSAASVQSNSLWGAYTRGTPKSTSFTLPTCQAVSFGRLYLDVYGATPYYSGQVTATLNGNALPTLTIGGTGEPSPGMPGDGNPNNQDPNATCVYGSGYAFWQIAYHGVAPYLNTDGTPNVLEFTVTDPNNQFDGRQYGATLVAIYSDPSIQQILDYQLFEGDVYMRSTNGSTPPSPVIKLDTSLAINGVNTSDVLSATYTAGYATGHSGKSDQLYFNGTAMGPTAGLGNDIARANNSTEVHTFDVAPYLQASNNLTYSIDATLLGGDPDTPLHATMGLLTVAHPIPEPASLSLLALAALSFGPRTRKV